MTAQMVTHVDVGRLLTLTIPALIFVYTTAVLAGFALVLFA